MDILVNLGSGAIGSMLTLGAGLAVRLRAIRGEVAKNDRLIRQQDDVLATWISDDHVRLERELKMITLEYSSPSDGGGSQLYSGAHVAALARAKEDALHRYRDQERTARQIVLEIEASEGWLHRRYRDRAGTPRSTLATPDKAQVVLDRWRDAQWHVPEGLKAVQLDDPTRRSLDALVAVIKTPASARPSDA